MNIHPYLFFNGDCAQAVDFYKKALGAEVDRMMKYEDGPAAQPGCPPMNPDWVMHVTLRIGDAVLMASDGPAEGSGPTHKGFAIALTSRNTAETTRVFTALAEGGKVTMPLGKTFWSQLFGMVTDKFGVDWMVDTAH
jgi:PhnB protein